MLIPREGEGPHRSALTLHQQTRLQTPPDPVELLGRDAVPAEPGKLFEDAVDRLGNALRCGSGADVAQSEVCIRVVTGVDVVAETVALPNGFEESTRSA